MKWVPMAVRPHTPLGKGYNVIQDKLEPEVRDQMGGALHTYSRRKKQLATVDTNTQNIASALKEAYPGYIT